MNELRIKSATNIYVIKDNKLLLGKRKKIGNGFWGLPGGHLEYGETPLEGAKRELEEETGLKADNLVYKNTVNEILISEGTHYISINFIFNNPSDEPELIEPDKFYEWKWFDLKNLPENIFIGHKKIIDNFQSKEILIN
jgi:8-oxo-dGTP diphosphatase